MAGIQSLSKEFFLGSENCLLICSTALLKHTLAEHICCYSRNLGQTLLADLVFMSIKLKVLVQPLPASYVAKKSPNSPMLEVLFKEPHYPWIPPYQRCLPTSNAVLE